MQVKLLRSLGSDWTTPDGKKLGWVEGETKDADDATGKALIEKGLAELVQLPHLMEAKPEPEPKPKPIKPKDL